MKTHLRFDAPFFAFLLGGSLLAASAALLGAAAHTSHTLVSHLQM